MHRLNTAEYNATVQDVLGTKLAPATPSWRGGEKDGFDNIAAVLGATTLNTDAALSSTLDRMLTDSKSSRFVTNFVGQWLGARSVEIHPVDKTLYPS